MDENTSHRLRKRPLLKAAHPIGLFLAMLVICLPGLWIVLSSLRPTVEIMAKPPVWIPQELSLDAYRRHVLRHRPGRHSGDRLFPQLADHLDHVDGDRHRHRHGGRLRLCALPLPRQVGLCSSA